MKLNFKYCVLMLLIMSIMQPSGAQVPEKQVLKEAEKVFDAELTIERQELGPVSSGGEQPAAFREPAIPVQPADELFALYAGEGQKPLGYCFASSAEGRFENFEYFILYDTARVVQKVKVWKYRSSHGGAVAGRRWLLQFEGYRKGNLSYGKDVQAISGATISGNALVSEVVRAGKVMDKVVL